MELLNLNQSSTYVVYNWHNISAKFDNWPDRPRHLGVMAPLLVKFVRIYFFPSPTWTILIQSSHLVTMFIGKISLYQDGLSKILRSYAPLIGKICPKQLCLLKQSLSKHHNLFTTFIGNIIWFNLLEMFATVFLYTST